MHGLTEIKWENNFYEEFKGWQPADCLKIVKSLKILRHLILNKNSSLIFQSQKWVKSKIAQNNFFIWFLGDFHASFEYLHILNLVTLQEGSYDYFSSLFFCSFSRNIFHVPQWIFLHSLNLQKLNAFFSFFKINAQNLF